MVKTKLSRLLAACLGNDSLMGKKPQDHQIRRMRTFINKPAISDAEVKQLFEPFTDEKGIAYRYGRPKGVTVRGKNPGLSQIGSSGVEVDAIEPSKVRSLLTNSVSNHVSENEVRSTDSIFRA